MTQKVEQQDTSSMQKSKTTEPWWLNAPNASNRQTSNRGDSKTIYANVKPLSSLVSRGVNTRPTAVYLYQEQGGKEATAKLKPEELAGERGKVNDENTRQDNPEEFDGERGK